MTNLSIVVPTYKRPELLIRCLESIYLNLGGAIQVVVVDDSDGGEGFEVSKKYPITYVKKSNYDRRGLAGSRNIGLKHCIGNYVAFIDDDDFLATDHLNEMVNNANGADFVYGNHFEFANDNLKMIDIGRVGIEEMLVYNRLPPGSFAIKREKIFYNFDEDLRSHEDWDFILKNIFGLILRQFDCYPIVMDKSENFTSSHMARTRDFFWLDFLAVYAKFPSVKLAVKRSIMLKSLGLDMSSVCLEIDPYVNQRNFDGVLK